MVIGGFPTFVYSEVKEHKIGKGALECAICLCDFETLRLIQKCDHVFHQECIDEWLSGQVTCPVSRANIVPPFRDSVKGKTDCSGPEEQYHVEIDIDEATVASEEVMPGKNEEGGSEQSNWDLGRESHSGKPPRQLGRSHSTGHSLVRPKDDTERFTLRLPDEVRKQIMERPTTPYFPGEVRGSRVRFLRRLDPLERPAKSERWAYCKMPLFLPWVSSVAPPKSPKFTNDGCRADRVEKSAADRDRLYESGQPVGERDA